MVIKLSDLRETDLLDIHFQKIIKELLNLYAMLESYGDADDSRLENQSDIQQLQNDILFLMRKYVMQTGNIEQILTVINNYGLDNPNPYLRFKYMQSIQKIIMTNYKHSQSEHKQPLTSIGQFVKMVEKLISKAKGDRTDSIKIEAQT